ncbi:MAG: aldose 1-epimerase [Ruminococcaceae bacterium]|nr:aldose 1-epimerase [Oscillospiraceae bacterium]
MMTTDIKLKNGGYVAEFRSDIGGNCYRLYHEPTGAEILRSPENEDMLFSQVFLFGNAILFPPNRIRDGEFEFNGKKYKFPVNEPSTNSHLHGALYKEPFKIVSQTNDTVELLYEAKAGEYLGFPHAFRILRSYKLDETGLSEKVKVFNDSEEKMPFMLAFHTTFNIPFTPDACEENCYMKVAVGKEHIRDQKYLPTLEYIGGREREKSLNCGTYQICRDALSAFYDNFNTKSEIIDTDKGLKIVYEGDENYKYRMLWVKKGAKLAVIEPQTCAIDCFHLEESAEKKGLVIIEPNESKEFVTKFSIASIK